MLTVFTGGARSGKSAAATHLAATGDGPVQLIATAEAFDAEMAARIDRHRAERPASWGVIEEPRDLDRAVDQALGKHPSATVVIDCLALWVTNRLADTDEEIIEAARRVALRLAAHDGLAVIVTNEVGDGIVPENETARRFRDVLGFVNQAVVQQAERAYLCVAGRLLPLHRLQEI